MIVVVEGVSATGKTKYASGFGTGRWVPEYSPTADMSATDASAEIHARYWTAQNAMRFQVAMAQESAGGVALCDSDPLKLHYDWCMGRAGFSLIDRFSLSKPMVRDAILQEKLGFADLYLIKQVEPETARKQKEED